MYICVNVLPYNEIKCYFSKINEKEWWIWKTARREIWEWLEGKKKMRNDVIFFII